jgi:hypothetical protein
MLQLVVLPITQPKQFRGLDATWTALASHTGSLRTLGEPIGEYQASINTISAYHQHAIKVVTLLVVDK